MDRGDELEEWRRTAVDRAAEAGVTLPPEMEQGGEGARWVARAADVAEGVVTAVAEMDVVTDLIEVLPAIASESMEVLGTIGEALGDVLDFDS